MRWRMNCANNKKRGENMSKYICEVCGWVYDEEVGCPEKGIAAGTKFEELPDGFECALCGVGKEFFMKES